MIILTSAGRPVARFPLFRFRDGGQYCLHLTRIDFSDVGELARAEAFYTPLVVVERDNQMTTVKVNLSGKELIIFIAPRKVSWHVGSNNDEETEQ